jgi:hypothetical protein
MASSSKDPKKKKPGGRTITKPPTRSHFKAFHSNAAEVGALVRELEKQFEHATQQGDTPQGTWTQYNSQMSKLLNDLSNKCIHYYTNTLPRLREIAKNSQYQGANRQTTQAHVGKLTSSSV